MSDPADDSDTFDADTESGDDVVDDGIVPLRGEEVAELEVDGDVDVDVEVTVTVLASSSDDEVDVVSDVDNNDGAKLVLNSS